MPAPNTDNRLISVGRFVELYPSVPGIPPVRGWITWADPTSVTITEARGGGKVRENCFMRACIAVIRGAEPKDHERVMYRDGICSQKEAQSSDPN